MSSKRPPSLGFIENPFIKKRNLEWRLDVPGSKTDDGGEGEDEEEQQALRNANEGISRDPVVMQDSPQQEPGPKPSPNPETINLSAALESGAMTQPDPATHFFTHLAQHTLDPYPSHTPHLSAGPGVGVGAGGSNISSNGGASFRDLFLSHAGSRRGAHFVVHQHDHPIAGVHYDLRLQVNETSSVSWAVMYGLPGDANSTRLNRNATETRVHCLWNHVVEVGSGGTGSLVVWDCGWFEVLGRGGEDGPAVDPDSGGDDDDGDEGGTRDGEGGLTEQEKLARAFGERKIRLRLHGSRLPERYVLNLRLTKGEDAEGRRKSARALGRPVRKRRRGGGKQTKKEIVETSSDGESGDVGDGDVVPDPLDGDGGDGDYEGDETKLSAMEREIQEVEDEFVRRTNAYRGAENSVGSVYQRRWYLSLDREACGFEKRSVGGKRVWVLKDSGGVAGGSKGNKEGGNVSEFDESGRLRFPFYVRGPDVERSIVTGRKGDEVLRDGGVEGFVRRKGWRSVLN
ncbi:hypothetical protein CSAL01_09302 [Colletotrichum salicis]|uniref:DNA ligase D 3'-phosphoesterase domain-containing protein n=1 Tax=Colletotrichum salicis TaxID=1209931 RepID=A0A135TR97_9PEZI|nr:hypothetical protein CSAL01_09302 [Colletotrichum salicis]